MTITPSEIYTISSFKSENDSIEATITFNEKHPIFSGHFPDNPIVPGVVQVQIIKDLAARHLNETILLSHAKNIKFLSIISPIANRKVEVILLIGTTEGDGYPVQASIRRGSTTFMKFSGFFKPGSV